MTFRIALISAVIMVTCIVGFAALTIKGSKDCDQLVIDTAELYSGIDIPKVDYINCYFNETQNTRVSIYTLRDLISIDKFISKNQFDGIDIKDLNLLEEVDKNELPVETRLYATSGKSFGNEWQYIVEKESRRLWVVLKYN